MYTARLFRRNRQRTRRTTRGSSAEKVDFVEEEGMYREEALGGGDLELHSLMLKSKRKKMSSKIFLFVALLLAFELLISSQVSARDLAETSTGHNKKEEVPSDPNGVGEAKFGRVYGRNGGNNGAYIGGGGNNGANQGYASYTPIGNGGYYNGGNYGGNGGYNRGYP